MQRLRLDALQDRAGRLYRHDKPFNGIAYEVKGDRVTANYQVTEGNRGGPAEVWDPGRPRVLGRAIKIVSVDETDERFPAEGAYLDGAPFHGIAYAFEQNTGVLFAETDFHPTEPGPSREWYRSGAPKAESDRPRQDGSTESESWHENGQSAGIKSVTWGFGLTPDGRLRTLRLELGFPKDALERLTFRVDSMLFLAGPGVTDSELARLEDIIRVEDLELSRTGISASGLGRFHVCTNLKKLTTRNNAGFGEADVRNLLAHLPACKWDPCRRCPRCGNRTYSGTAWTVDKPEDCGEWWIKCPACGYSASDPRAN
jgi:hypothetical protein